ncbi:MAG TPA: protein kinase [Vicinamibacteria bacterium]|nr:protein kinase [Vicinamibacteria bacterium]
MRSFPRPLMALAPGERLGPYAIQALLGSGGMGEVYRGRDTRLGRDVALKVISPARLGDPAFRRRFEIEARAASALNHPAIVTVYDVGDADGIPWIAMEWVEGQTLRSAIDAGPLPMREALAIARQIADGLAVAHAKGVVHRDLKPSNIMLTAEGRCKILDFGLARQTLGDAPESQVSQADTMASPPREATQEGAILGTAGYMSPEQAMGRRVDFHSDQFSFGLIAYEMLTGRRAFEGSSSVETLAAIIRDEPAPLSSLRPGIPEPLQRLVNTCLAKRPEDRFASTRELASALEAIATGATGAVGGPTETDIAPPLERLALLRLRRGVLFVGAALGLALVATWATRHYVSRSRIQSLAVLPFENASQEAEAEYLSDGLTESLIDQMSQVPSLRVMARSTVFRFKGATDPLEAGRKLGVGAVLTGTVARKGDRVAISAELVEIETGARLWGDRYDRPVTDMMSVGDSLALGIASGLRLRLSGADEQSLRRHGTENAQAYDLYLRARHRFAGEAEEDDIEARRLVQQAIEKDPRFLEAHLLLWGAYLRSLAWTRPAEVWPQADEALRRAREIDPDNVRVRAAQATQRFVKDWDWAGAEREYRAVMNDPRLFTGDGFRGFAMFLWARGRPEEAAALTERALEADPGNIESGTNLADFLSHAGRLEEAVRRYREVVEADPSNPQPLFGLADVLRRQGDISGAIAALRSAYELTQEEEGVRALTGARSEADYERAEGVVDRARLASLEALAKERYVSPMDLARLHARLGEREQAFALLEEAHAERSSGLLYMKVDHAWDRVRDDARFAAMVRRVGVP